MQRHAAIVPAAWRVRALEGLEEGAPLGSKAEPQGHGRPMHPQEVLLSSSATSE